MPYGISEETEECELWATVKVVEEGMEVIACHATKQEAIDHMIAVSLEEGVEPLGEVEGLEELIAEDDDEEEAGYEQRQVNLVAPGFMAASARRGLRLHEEGESGDGLVPATVADARRMAEGEALSESKWRRIAPWIARHIVDLDAVEGDEITPGLVAMLLWGGGSSKTSARRAQEYAERIISQLDEEADRQTNVANIMSVSPVWVSKNLDGDRSRAFIKTELRASADGTSLVGYASVFDSPSEPLPWIEYVKRGAFAKTLEADADVRLLMDHEGIPLARTKSGTLRLSEDEVGLRVEADLDPENPMARGVMSAMKRGDLSQMSFAFRTIRDSWSDDRSTRELEEVELFDVSVVTFPAYEATTAELREAQSSVSVPSQRSLLLRKNQVAIARHKIGDQS
jgi:HK97 family phage prohead protease